MLELFFQFAVELARALFIDVVSGRIRELLAVFKRGRKICGTAEVFRHVHRRNRDRLLHRLHTVARGDL
jgi:hypothetical protein